MCVESRDANEITFWGHHDLSVLQSGGEHYKNPFNFTVYAKGSLLQYFQRKIQFFRWKIRFDQSPIMQFHLAEQIYFLERIVMTIFFS